MNLDDVQRYDRQIRIWGLEAQEKIQSGAIGLVGMWEPVAQEIMKNLVLAGIGALFLLDQSRIVDSQTEMSLLSEGKSSEDIELWLRHLNPSADIHRGDEALLLERADIVVHCGGSFVETAEWDEKCRSAGLRFYHSSVTGHVGINCCACLGDSLSSNLHEALQKPAKKRTAALANALGHWIESELEQSHLECTAAVSSVIGGHAAQDLIRILCSKEQQLSSILVFDGLQIYGALL